MKISRKLFVLFLLISLIFTFAACKKSIEFNINFVSDGETVHTISTAGNEKITLPENPTKDGYVFDGWYWDKDVWEMPFTASSLLNVPLQNDMKVYAKWLSYEETIPKYTVTFETNGGTSVKSIVASVIEEAPSTKKDYNSFVGWYTDISLQESTKVAFPFTPSQDVTLYAKWTVDFTEGLQMTLQTSTNTYFVTGYIGGDADIIIPSTYKGLEVTGINARAFEGNSTIRTVIIPDSVITVGLGAFSECYNLVSVDMSDQVQLLGASAFSNCIKLEAIDLPNTLQNIGGEAFFGCTALKELYLSNELGNIGTNIIRGCNSLSKLTLPGRITLISLVGDTNDNIPKGLKEIQIAEGSEVVCENMLYNCAQIESLTIASSVKSIKNSAFYGLKNLKEINLYSVALDDLTKGNQAFSYIGQDAENGTTVNIGNNVTRVPAYLFYPNTDSTQFCNITSIIFEETSICESIGDYAFGGCKALTSVTIPDSVTSIGFGAFGGCSNLENLTVPFVGSSASATSASSSTLFGYIFGTASYTGGIATEQYYSSSSKTTYYVPSSLKKVTVTGGSINYGAFYNCSNLTNVIIDGGVTSIGTDAFYNCSSLKNATIGDSVTSIGYNAFSGCTSLKSVTIGNGVTSIKERAFYDCTSLTSVNYLGTIEQWCNISFVNDIHEYTTPGNPLRYAEELYINNKLVTELVIPNAVTEIKNYAFYGYKSLENITTGDGVASIGYGAFSNCTLLTSVTIGDSVTSIGGMAFLGCSSLTSVTIGDSVTSIGGMAFLGCSSLESVTIPDNVTEISAYAFYNCTSLSSITIPDSVTSIGYEMFYNCSSLTSITIPDSVTSIGQSAFSGCSSLTSITIPDSVTSIGQSTFSGCSSLTSITIPFVGEKKDGTTSNTYFGYIFGASSYSQNNSYVPSSLKEVIITDATYIAWRAFEGCSSLTSITIPDSITSIGDDAFYNCTALTEINFNAIDSTIGNYAFYDAGISGKGITVTIGKNVTKIPANLFYSSSSQDAPKITSVAFEEGSVCESIGTRAFYNCKSLATITIPDSVTSIGQSAFSGCSSLSSITIPDSVTSIGYAAFYGCSSLTSVTIGDNVTSIGEYAFRYCTNLTIYCEATSKPSDWASTWNYSNRPIYWYSENEPTTEGNYWHYVNGEVVVWE